MRTLWSRCSFLPAAAMLCLTILTGCGHTYQPAPPPTIAIDSATKLFSPFVTVVNANAIVAFTNNDTAMHDALTVPDADYAAQRTYLNPISLAVHLAPGSSVSVTFAIPGIYDLYDDTQATIDPVYHRVKANKGTPGFPYAPEAVIWVKGPLPGFAPNPSNHVVAGQDDFQLDFNAVASSSTVTWHNYDTDKHYVVPGAFNGNTTTTFGDGINEIDGTQAAPPDGGDTRVAFYNPGLYYYYCSAHADFDANMMRAKAHKDASIYPEVMEGFVLVVL